MRRRSCLHRLVAGLVDGGSNGLLIDVGPVNVHELALESTSMALTPATRETWSITITATPQWPQDMPVTRKVSA